MDDQDFDKVFGSQLPNFASSDWRDMEGRLERNDLKRKITKLMWTIPIMGGVMASVVAIMYYHLYKTQNQVKELENKLVLIHSKHFQPLTEKKPIILYDTIYRKIIINTQTIVQKPSLAISPDNTYYSEYDKNFTENQQYLEREKYVGVKRLNLKDTHLNSDSSFQMPVINTYPAIIQEEDSIVEENHFSLIPKSITTGVLGALQKPIGDDYGHAAGGQVGIRTVLGYYNKHGKERWGIVIDLSRNNLSFDSNKDNVFERFNGIEPPKPYGSSYKPKQIDISTFSTYQIELGMRYNLLFSERFKPYFGLNWNIQVPDWYKVEYFYDNPVNNTTDANVQPNISHSISANIGSTYTLSNKLSTSAELFYQSKILQPSNYLNPMGIFGARVSLNYRLSK